ncbi:MAG: NADH-quinone oxidoreductase subunit M [Chloroflexota bacterium]
MNYILLTITLLPLVGALFVLMTPQDSGKKYVALGTTLLTFLVSLVLWFGWDSTNSGMQFVQHSAWIPEANIYFHLGVDGISMPLVLLTTFLMPIAVAFSNQHITDKVGPYLVLMLGLQSAMTGVFVALDMVVFFLFFEASLIPMYFLISRWGGDNRLYAAIKFFLYTLAGSAGILSALLGVLFMAGTVDVVAFQEAETLLPMGLQVWAFFAMAIGFGIKVPIFPFHTWLPDAHVQAPTAGSIILAGILLKMGTYGYVRFILPFFPDAAAQYGWIIAILAIIGIIYGALVALVQKDIKSLVAYSSVAHLGFVMLGIFSLNEQGISGAVLQMVNHGLSTGALFLMVGILYERRHTRMLDDFGGLWASVPVFTSLFLVVAMSSAGLPGLNGFVGEFTILLGMWATNPWFAAFGALGVILAAWYLLVAFRKMAQGPITNEANSAENLADLNRNELAMIVPLIVLFFVIGLFPNLFLDKISPSVAAMLGNTENAVIESHAASESANLTTEYTFTVSTK